MTDVRLRLWSAMLCVLCLTGVGRSGPEIGFADLPRLVAGHRLHAVLAEYEREIAALRATQSVPGLVDAAGRAQRAAAAIRSDAAAAQSRVRNVTAVTAGFDRVQEYAALDEISAWHARGDRGTALYGDELSRETNASVTAFERATAQRNARAYAARATELHERELALAYALARRDAAQRLSLRLKLGELHLARATRRALEGQRSMMDRREAQAIDAARSNDAAILASYSNELQRAGARANAQMAAQLRAKAAANLDVRRRVSQAESNAGSGLPNFAQRLALFRSSDHSTTDARSIADGFHAASVDVANKFDALAASDRESRRATAVQIRRVEADRSALYRSIVAQIVRTAKRLGQERHLTNVILGAARPPGSVDLTAAVRGQLARP
jgi:hypothetical protein